MYCQKDETCPTYNLQQHNKLIAELISVYKILYTILNSKEFHELQVFYYQSPIAIQKMA